MAPVTLKFLPIPGDLMPDDDEEDPVEDAGEDGALLLIAPLLFVAPTILIPASGWGFTDELTFATVPLTIVSLSLTTIVASFSTTVPFQGRVVATEDCTVPGAKIMVPESAIESPRELLYVFDDEEEEEAEKVPSTVPTTPAWRRLSRLFMTSATNGLRTLLDPGTPPGSEVDEELMEGGDCPSCSV